MSGETNAIQEEDETGLASGKRINYVGMKTISNIQKEEVMVKFIGIILMLIAFSSCASSMSQIGTIGLHQIYQVKTCDMVSPCTTTILTHSAKDGALNKIEGGTGPSILGQVLGPASVASAGYFIGDGLGDSGDKNSITSNSDGSTAQAAGGAAVAGATSRAGVINNQELEVRMNQNTAVGIGIGR